MVTEAHLGNRVRMPFFSTPRGRRIALISAVTFLVSCLAISLGVSYGIKGSTQSHSLTTVAQESAPEMNNNNINNIPVQPIPDENPVPPVHSPDKDETPTTTPVNDVPPPQPSVATVPVPAPAPPAVEDESDEDGSKTPEESPTSEEVSDDIWNDEKEKKYAKRPLPAIPNVDISLFHKKKTFNLVFRTANDQRYSVIKETLFSEKQFHTMGYLIARLRISGKVAPSLKPGLKLAVEPVEGSNVFVRDMSVPLKSVETNKYLTTACIVVQGKGTEDAPFVMSKTDYCPIETVSPFPLTYSYETANEGDISFYLIHEETAFGA